MHNNKNNTESVSLLMSDFGPKATLIYLMIINYLL